MSCCLISASRLLHVLRQERHRALPGEVGGGFLIAAALVAVEAVLGVGIDVDLAIAAALAFDYFDVAHRDRSVLLAEMHLHGDFRLLIGVLGDLAAVIANGGGEAVEL